MKKLQSLGRTPYSHHTALCKFDYFFSFLTKCMLLEMWMVGFVSLPFLAIYISDSVTNIIIGACFVTTYGSLFRNFYLASLNVLEPFMHWMLHCTHFQQYIEQLELEHLCNDKLVHHDKTQYIRLYFYQYIYSPTRWNHRTPSFGSHY